MGLLDVRPDDLLPILAIILVVLVIAVSSLWLYTHPFRMTLPYILVLELRELLELVVLMMTMLADGLCSVTLSTSFCLSKAIPTASEYSYISASNPEEPKPLPSLGDTPSVHLSIVVPAYDETERLKPMIDSTLAHMQSLRPHRSFEILIVDDGSRDGTAELALKLSISHAKTESKDEIRVVRLETNRGKGGAVKHGFMHARGERILFVDADDATRFSDLETLWSKMDEMEGDEASPAIVIGSRAHLVNSEAVVQRSKIRNFLMKGFHTTLRILGVGHIADTQCGFKLFNRAAAQQVFPPLHLPTWIFDVEILMVAQALNIPVLEIPVHWKEIPGSKLNIAGASLGMLRDLLLMRANYMLGRWTPYDFRED